MLRLCALAVTYALLTACAAQPPVEKDPVADTAASSPAVDIPERSFPEDSLYPLLVAEFALRRRAYDIALDQYMEQAPRLRDAGVSAHTTHLTQFLQREDDALESARLWVELDPDNPEANNTLAALLAHRGQAVAAYPILLS